MSDISPEGAKLNALITFRGEFIVVQYGFVWGESENPTISDSERTIYASNIESNNFTTEIKTTLKKNVKYYVRSFIQTDQYITYGENVEFMSLGSGSPIIDSIEPQSGYRGDTLHISGENFSYIENTVYIDQIEAGVLSNSDTAIYVLVPDCLDNEQSKIIVAIKGNLTLASQSFRLLLPNIQSFSPMNGGELDVIEIHGEGFQSDKAEVYFGEDVHASVLESSSTYLKVQLPESVNESGINGIRYSNGCKAIVSDKVFTLDGVLLTSISKETAIIGRDIVMIEGSGLSANPDDNLVVINGTGYMVDFLETSENKISFYLPGDCPIGECEITVSTTGKCFNNPFMLNAITPWERKSDLPGPLFGSYGSTFVIDGKIYFANSTDTEDFDFWAYDSATDSWSRKSDIPGPPYTLRVAFAIEGKGYLGTGDCVAYYCGTGYTTSSEFFSYEPADDVWEQTSFPVPAPSEINNGVFGAVAFSVDNTGYMFGGFEDWRIVESADYWKYEYETDQWSVIGTFSGFADFDYLISPTGFVIDGKIYLGTGLIGEPARDTYTYTSKFWEYNPATDTWRSISDFPGGARSGAAGFSKNGKGYVGLGANSAGTYKDFWVYDPAGDNWRRIADLPSSPRAGGVAAVANNRAFVGFGATENDLWELK